MHQNALGSDFEFTVTRFDWRYRAEHFSGSQISTTLNRIGGVMVNVLASSVVNRGFKTMSGQTKYYNIGMCCFSAKHAVLRRKSKDWFARNQNNVPEWSDMSIRGLLCQ